MGPGIRRARGWSVVGDNETVAADSPRPGAARASARPGVQERWGIEGWARRLGGVRWLPLTAILVGQAALSLRLVWSNSAFTDEALYIWSGRLEWEHWLHGAPVPNFPSYFSGAPVVYPPLGAMAAALGGLYAARILSLFFMLFATVLLRRNAAHLRPALGQLRRGRLRWARRHPVSWGVRYVRRDGPHAAGACHMAVRRAAQRSGRPGSPHLRRGQRPGLADAAKYAATLFDPVVVIVAGLVAWQNKGRKYGVITVLAVLWILGLLLFLGVRIGGHSYRRGINTSRLPEHTEGHRRWGSLRTASAGSSSPSSWG